MKMNFPLKAILATGMIMLPQTGNAWTVVVNQGQIASLDVQELLTKIKMIQQVKNQLEQIDQLADQIDIAEYTNDILGEYGLGDLSDIAEVKDSFDQLAEVKDLSSILDGIIDAGEFDADDLFGNTFGGGFEAIEAPDTIVKSEYQSFSSYERAMEIARQETEMVRSENIALGEEAASLREAAKSAPNKATYNQLVDKAKAAESAIVRNNQRAELAVANSELIGEAAVNHEKKREKALNDRAREAAREENEAAAEAFATEPNRIR